MSLYNDHRPNSLLEMKGNKETIRTLQSKIDKKKVVHTILFEGPKGCGKTTLARITAKEFGCSEIDLNELNCADHNGVNDIRELRPLIRNKALDGEYRAWILDECHRLTPDAQSALLKMLEEPPSHVLFFLCTTDSQKLLGTILSRCMRLVVEPLTEQQTVILLSNICKKEKKSVPKEVLSQIAIDSLGHPRDALSILESIIDLDIKDMELSARKVAEQQNAIIDLCQSLYKKKRWNEIAKILSNLKDEPETIRRSILGYCNSILLKGDNPWAYIIMDCFKETFFYTGRPGLTLACYEALEAIKENK